MVVLDINLYLVFILERSIITTTNQSYNKRFIIVFVAKEITISFIKYRKKKHCTTDRLLFYLNLKTTVHTISFDPE